MGPSIRLENVGLRFPIKAHRRTTLKELIVHGLLRRPSHQASHFSALSEISLQIDAGECVGVIGRNGAGKSTLLRAVAGVFPVSVGQRNVSGRICSLFDIAAGSEWNATGWENIRLRAYLQGESPASLRGKLERIAAFTDLGEMLDLPVKCFSTGRIMLLSFAIAVACDPDILLVDEFLSTGDLPFRAKAIREMVAMQRQGRIVMMAGHDLAFLRQFCTRLVWLDGGRIQEDGPTEHLIEEYLHGSSNVDTSARAVSSFA